MMQGVAIAMVIKGNSYQQTVQPFFTNKNNPPKSRFGNQDRNAGLSKACVSCGQEGHLTHACPQRTAYSYLPNPASTAMTLNLPKTPVLIVRRDITGYKTRSKFHKNGTLLVPDQQSGNWLRGQDQTPTAVGATSLNPFVPFVPSQSSSEQPQAAQDWTSVPPPQQY